MTIGTARQRSWIRLFALLFIASLLAINGVAWMQARAMMHYVSGGERTARPENLSFPQKVATLVLGVTVPRPENTHTPEAAGLSYDVRKINVNDGGYVEAWFIPSGAPQGLVIMFPAYATSKEVLLDPAAAFHTIGYNVLMVDFRGVGGSSGTDTTLGVREAGDVAAAVDYARRQWPGERLVLYGVSMGSAAILRAVAKQGVHPDALVLESPFNSLLDTAASRFHSMGLPAFPGAPLIVFWGSVQQGYNGFAHNPSDYARSVQCPVLLMYGRRDPRVTPQQSEEIYAHLVGPKESAVFPNASHELLVDADPALWKGKVLAFLEGLSQ